MSPSENTKNKDLAIKFSILFLCLLILSVFLSPRVNAQKKDQGLINSFPKDLPIKVEILNEDTEDLLEDVRIKVTNTGEKPIYFLEIFVKTTKDYVTPEGGQYGFFMQYGRTELIDVDNFANSGDIPIKPGESYIFRIDEIKAKKFKEGRKKEKRPLPKFYFLRFHMMNFGDGTGFLGGGPVSSGKRISSLPNEHTSPRKSNGFF